MKTYPIQFIHLEETHSTNSFLAQWCNTHETTEELTTVYADFQTNGRGQRGNGWESEAGSNLLFSYVLYPTFLEVSNQFFLSQIHALALQETLAGYTHDNAVTIKWPNDIYWHNCKLCGTLIENDWQGMHISRAITGTGINVNQETFFSDAPNPISLYQITGKKHPLHSILHEVMQRTAHYYDLLKQGNTDEIMDTYRSALYRREGLHLYQDENGLFNATIISIESNGKLILRDESGHLRGYMFKEVEFVL